MAKILTESSYITINIKELIGKQTPADDSGIANVDGKKPTEQTPKGSDAQAAGKDKTSKKPANGKRNWKKELEARRAENKQASADAKRPEYEVDEEFWTEYFTAGWGELAPKLQRIRQLKTDIEKLGFTTKENPLVKFLSLAYVKKALINPGLINNESYTALRLAYGKRYVAASEFMTANKYNIIYCPDWYKRSAADMETYLKLQQNILPSDARIYTEGIMDRNIRTFLPSKFSSMTKAGAVLNSIKEVQRTLGLSKDQTSRQSASNSNGNLGNVSNNTSSEGSAANGGKASAASSSEDIKNALGSIRSENPANGAAALQYIAMTTGSPSALKALASDKFAKVSGSDILGATAEVYKSFKGISFGSDKVVDQVVTLIKDKF